MSRASLFLTVILSASLFACSSSKSGSTNPEDANDSLSGANGSELADIHFDFDSSSLSNEAQSTLKTSAKWLMDHSKGTQVEGHCDERGTNEYNLALGERRARAAYDYLKTLGVSKDKLSTISYGEELPLDNGHTEAAWAKNRRDHFAVK